MSRSVGKRNERIEDFGRMVEFRALNSWVPFFVQKCRLVLSMNVKHPRFSHRDLTLSLKLLAAPGHAVDEVVRLDC